MLRTTPGSELSEPEMRRIVAFSVSATKAVPSLATLIPLRITSESNFKSN